MPVDQQQRLEQAAAEAHAAQVGGIRGPRPMPGGAYVLIEDALREPQEMLDEGVALSKVAIVSAAAVNDFAPASLDLGGTAISSVERSIRRGRVKIGPRILVACDFDR